MICNFHIFHSYTKRNVFHSEYAPNDIISYFLISWFWNGCLLFGCSWLFIFDRLLWLAVVDLLLLIGCFLIRCFLIGCCWSLAFDWLVFDWLVFDWLAFDWLVFDWLLLICCFWLTAFLDLCAAENDFSLKSFVVTDDTHSLITRKSHRYLTLLSLLQPILYGKVLHVHFHAIAWESIGSFWNRGTLLFPAEWSVCLGVRYGSRNCTAL